jgi:hypothetical protein
MNVQTGLQGIALSTVFALLPNSVTQPAALFAVLFGLLYMVQDKIPSPASKED